MDNLDDERFLLRMQDIQTGIAGIKIKFDDRMVPVSVSLGAVKVSHEKYLDVEEVLERADQAMLEVKKSGRGEIKFIR